MARFERSCGMVVYREDPRAGREYLLLHYPTGHWDFAKGHVEKGEEDIATALRETREETGIEQIEVRPDFRHEFEYGYRHHQTQIQKRVSWFLGRVESRHVKLSHEHQGYVWLPYPLALERVTYANAKELLRRAEACLLKNPRTFF